MYFAWGEAKGYKDANEKGFTWDDYELMGEHLLKYSRDDGLTTLEACDDAATQNMGDSWRMPTLGEYQTLLSATTNEWVTTVNGVKSMLFTDKTDESKKLFFPAVGHCYNGSVRYMGSHGFYWSNSLNSPSIFYSLNLYFSSRCCYMDDFQRFVGSSVRGVIK